jgi:hypothetical protein
MIRRAILILMIFDIGSEFGERVVPNLGPVKRCEQFEDTPNDSKTAQVACTRKLTVDLELDRIDLTSNSCLSTYQRTTTYAIDTARNMSAKSVDGVRTVNT